MDLAVKFLEPYTFNLVLPDSWSHSSFSRQFVELLIVLAIGGELIYLVGSGLDWFLFFDKSWLQHKKILRNQVSREIWSATTAAPFIALLTAPFLLGEWRGYSKMYYWPSEGGGVPGMLLSGVMFLLWTDCFVYWIHRFLHTFTTLYKHIHKEHHVWIIPTPWAACAFHPIDGWAQSIPYLLFPYVFPVQKHQYMVMYAFVKLWSVSIHDRNSLVENWLVNGASHHDIHHRRYNFNYGQYFTIWDRIGSSHYNADLQSDPDALSPAQLASRAKAGSSDSKTKSRSESKARATARSASPSPARRLKRSASKKQR